MGTPQHLSTIRAHRDSASAYQPKHAGAVVHDWHLLRRYLATGVVSALIMCACALPATAFAADDATGTVEAYAFEKNVAVEVGDVTVAEGNGVVAVATDGKSASVSTGSITSGGSIPEEGFSGVLAATQDNSSVTVTVNGDIQASQNGVRLFAYEGSSTGATVNGSISASEYAGMVLSAETGSKTEATVTDGISSVGEGVYAGADGKNSSVSFTVGGPIQAGGIGQLVVAKNGSTIDSAATGDVTSEGKDGIHLEADTEAALKSTVTGNVTSKCEDGLDLFILTGGAIESTVTGNISGVEDGVIVRSSSNNSTANVVVNGAVTGGFAGVCSVAGGTTINATVNGDVSSDGNGVYVGVNEYEGFGGTVNITVNGNVTSRDTGFYFNADDMGTINALITGTLSGEMAGVSIYTGEKAGVSISKDPSYTADALDLTVWKIVPVGGAVAFEGYYEQEADGQYTSIYVPNESFEKTIKYIVKVEQPEAGATLSATDAAGKALLTSQGYQYAFEGDKVLLMVDLEEGYRLLGAYNGEGEKVDLLVDDAGNCYVVVPKGGGVYLSVELEKVPEPKPAPVPGPEAAKSPATGSALPATGDPVDAALPLALAALSAVAAGALALRRREDLEAH